MPNYQRLPRADSGGPSIEPSVLRRLRSISPGLRTIWRNHRWDPFDPDHALITKSGPGTGEPVPWQMGGGRFLMFHDAGKGCVEFLFVIQTRSGAYHPVDHRVCDRLVADLARTMTPSQIVDYAEQLDVKSRLRLKEKLDDLNLQKFSQNPRKVREAMESIGTGREAAIEHTRSPAAIFYPGMDSHESSAERRQIPLTPSEEGWELPDVKKELHD